MKDKDYSSCKYGSASETLQLISDHESHNDSAYFNFITGEQTNIVGAVIRIGMRPNESYSEASIVMPRRDGSVAFYYKRSPLLAHTYPVGSQKWESTSLKLEAVDATRRWQLSFSEKEAVRLVSDPRSFADKPGEVWRASSPLECEFNLSWEADYPMHVLSASGNLMPDGEEVTYGKNHYEQFGNISGSLRLGEEEWQIESAPSFRDHSWGPRVWESAPDQDFVTLYLDDGRRAVALANRLDGREDAHGVIWKPGDATPIQIRKYQIRSDYAGEPLPTGLIEWTLLGGDEVIEVEGEVVGCMPLRVGKNPVRIAQTILRLKGDSGGWAKTDLTRPIKDR
ncbi:MAG: hypothetical protein ACI9SC_001420 [Gammaproteobacteria bacterium]|jgi:hypothetical protein